VRLFGRKNKEGEAPDQTSDDGAVGLWRAAMGGAEQEYAKFVEAHLRRIHEPGGYALEKKENDFMDLGMRRSYLDALDGIEFSVDDTACQAMAGGRAVGIAQVITRWTVRGQHNRPLLGVPPSGGQVTVGGVTYTTFRNYYLKLEYTYWDFPDLARRLAER
jgi:hypothetical protein